MFKRWLESSFVHTVLISSAIAGLTLSAARFAVFEPLELRAYDWMMRSRPQQSSDPRLLIVSVTEADLQWLKATSPSDRTLAQAIEILQQHQPRVIGIDFYRDLPQGEGQAQLRKQLKAPNVTGIYRIGSDKQPGIPAPQGMAPEQTGFNDLSIDADGVLRRALIFANEETSFAMQTAFIYLEKSQILPQASSSYPGILQLGASTFLPLASTSGGYRTADTSGHQILLNYRTPNIARQIRLKQLFDRQFDPRWFKDKIVLIGNTALSSNDFFYTPYSPNQHNLHRMSGIEIHAQIISQVLDAATGKRSLINALPSWTESLWIVSWVLLSGLIANKVRRLPLLGGIQASLVIVLLSSGVIALELGTWLSIVAPLIGMSASSIGIIIYRIQRLQHQNRIAIALLGQNTSPKVAQALWKNRHTLIQSGKLPGQEVTATLLFADLQGFSSMSEKLSPEALLNWLNDYLAAMTEQVTQHDGIVNKFTGDGLFAVFGVPIPRTDETAIAQDAQNAVNSAIAMSEKLSALNQQWIEQGLGSFRMRIGICTGTVVVGSLGSKDRIEYGVIGDSVNTAARLEACLKEQQPSDCRILISESTQQYLDDRIPLEAWGAIQLNGKQRSVTVYRVDPTVPYVPLRNLDRVSVSRTSADDAIDL
ncbi:adenylate/guanylate cyclase domain-containing protein [Pseudanabaenaceae cyanobacterium LEGE 13415]|nr:adenylate/guanylate cyclase domain-containing protein [Pseudanabaenaceae cyanobacterium LEGE 13415]